MAAERAKRGGSLNPNVMAMDHPITTMMLVVGLISLGILAYSKMRVDIFPALNTPKIYVFFDFIGMSPDQIEGFIVNELELYFQYVDGIQDIKSRNIQQVGLCELGFFHGTDMGQAMAQVVAMSDRAMAWMPPGSLPPMIMRMDAGSVPIGYLVFVSEGNKTSIGAMGDLAQNIIRPLVQKNVPGTVAISPFGPNMRSIVINVNPRKLLEYNLNPDDLVEALKTGNVVVPSGNIYVKDSMPIVHNNATVVDIKTLGDIPLKLGQNVYFRDVATIQDGTDIDYGYALVNGRKAVHLPIIKKDTGSTLTVVADVHKSMETFRAAVSPDVKITFEFDESPTVVHAVKSVATEGAIGAGLTGLMILLFLRDLRSVIVVVTNIPLALLGALVGLWVTGNTINIMSLGGMALAIGIPTGGGTGRVGVPERAPGGASRPGRRRAEGAATTSGASVLTGLLMVLVLGAAAAGTGAAVWAFREEGRARKAEQGGVDKEKKAQDKAAKYRGKFQQSEATWKAAVDELHRAQAAADDARRSRDETLAILDFFKKALLSAGRRGTGRSRRPSGPAARPTT